MKFRLVLTFLLATFLTANSQSLNQYKYVVVPWEYSFLKSANQYQLNELTKFLFEQEGFQTAYDKVERTAAWTKDPCLSLSASVENNSNMFSTKLTIELRDCHNKVIFKSEEGKSKIKDYQKGYQDALRKAFESIKALNYNYEPGSSDLVITEMKEDTETVATDTEVEEAKIIIEEVDLGARQEEQSAITVREAASANSIMPTQGELLYAQANKRGFHLVDSSPKVVFVLLESAKKDVYILQDRNGVLYKEGEKWYADFYANGTLQHVELSVKW